MAIHKKNGKYVPIVYMGKDPLTGKEIRKWGKYWDKKRDAEKEEAQMKLEREKMQSSSVFKAPTFDALVEQYIEVVAPAKYAASTIDMYLSYYRKHTEPVFKGKLLKEIEPMHIQRFIQSKKDLMPETQRKIFYFLKGMFDSAVKWRWISFNPCTGAELPSIKRNSEKEIWLPDEVAQFFKSDTIMNSKYYVMLLTSFSTGMRPGEVCALSWSSIAEDSISVTAGMDRKKRATDLKTDGSNRKIYIDKKLYLKFMLQSKWQKENRLLFGSEYYDSKYVFTHEDGTIITPYR